MGFGFSRRDALLVAAGVAAGALLPARRVLAQAAKDNGWMAAVEKFTGKKAFETGDSIKLDLPEIAENGNTVPMTVTINNPAGKYATDLLVVADGNPQPGVALFHFTAESAPEANTRIRCAETQKIHAIAKMNDGTFYTASREVKVTIGGCGG
jgi:sulfur-oxidizing protein SoxY